MFIPLLPLYTEVTLLLTGEVNYTVKLVNPCHKNF